MKIIFFGTPTFAANTLQYLLDNNQKVIGIVTAPDSRKGRGNLKKPCAVKEIALANNILVLQPEKLKSKDFTKKLKDLHADIFVVVAFRMLPQSVWKIPKKGTINLHASFLPNYRGAAPINWVLINGEKKTGISTFFINEHIDSGAVIQQKEIELNNKITAAQLHNKLIKYGSKLLIQTLHLIKENSVIKTPQVSDLSLVNAPKLTKEILKINWNKTAIDIHNLVRGLSPLINENSLLKDVSICPSAWFFLEDHNGKKKRIKLNYTEVIKSKSNNILEIISDNKNYLHIITKKHTIAVLNLQAEGKKPMTIKQFLQGNKISPQQKIK